MTKLHGIESTNAKKNYLMIAFKAGMVMLMADENDKEPIVFNTNVFIQNAKWNNTGDVITVSGLNKISGTEGHNLIEFYNNNGDLLKIIPVSTLVSAISFDG